MKTEIDWLERLAAHPDDLALRQRFADALTTDGDPRGEIIALSLAPADARRPDSWTRVQSLLPECMTRWEAALGLLPREVRLRDGMPDELVLTLSRALELWAALPMRLTRKVVVDVDVFGVEEPAETAKLEALFAAEGWPAALDAIHFRRDRNYVSDDPGERIARRITQEGIIVDIEFGAPEPRRLFLTALTAFLSTRPRLCEVVVGLTAANHYDVDAVFALLGDHGPWPQVTRLSFARCWNDNGDEMYVWIRSERIGKLLGSLPALDSLHLPPASLTLAHLEHERLRELHLFSFDGGHNGRPRESYGRDAIPIPPRASGLTFLPRSSLPRLEKLVIDFTYRWHVPWEPADLEALAAANLPALRCLVLSCIPDPDALMLHLERASWLEKLESLTLDESGIGAGAIETLTRLRSRMTSLKELHVHRPISKALGASLQRAYPQATSGEESE